MLYNDFALVYLDAYDGVNYIHFDEIVSYELLDDGAILSIQLQGNDIKVRFFDDEVEPTLLALKTMDAFHTMLMSADKAITQQYEELVNEFISA